MSSARVAPLVALVVVCSAVPAVAQPLGTFKWQLQPFCNIVSVLVTQQPSGNYTLDGTDDRCGGGNQPGSVVGIAYMTPLGLVGFGMTMVLPNGVPVHTEATISIASLNGTWRDSAGNNGNFVFTPGAGIGGAQRPYSTTGLAPASITNVLIANNAVTGANVTNASLTIDDLADPPRINFVGADQNLVLPATPTVVRTLNLTAPAAGRVIVTASGYFAFADAAVAETVTCSISTDTTVDNTALFLASEAGGVNAIDRVPFSSTRGFSVATGANTFRLVCDEGAGDVSVRDTHMTALFVPTP